MSATKHRPEEWQTRRSQVTTTARTTRSLSNGIRAEALETARQTTQRVQRVARDTENELNLRIDWVEHRRRDLKLSIEETLDEIGLLNNVKERVEEERAAKAEPTDINKECQDLRAQRYGIDLVDDEVDAELDHEAKLLSDVERLLTEAMEDAKEQLRLLRAAKYSLEKDLEAKDAAVSIDAECRSLDRSSNTITQQLDGINLQDDDGIDPSDWDVNTQHNLDQAEQERINARNLREDIEDLLQSASDRLTQQANKVEDAFNRRIGECKDALADTENNLDKTRLEIESMERLTEDLNASIDDKVPTLQLAQTRRQKRTLRPGHELVKDPAQATLSREVQEVQAAMGDLQAQKDSAEKALLSLRRTALELEEDVKCKTNTLNVDNACMQKRQQYKYRLV
ncbi:hypothetical protein PTSG_02584 [Salpingoeca rosetta]|uniref:Tektin n=1 Tax=Salpingoeca rosetta (strain ATCC 50818 / BSB-021) TaxID=946362 RepID=F2U2Q5_SALR5|nr:uncharacterized protein PTSG_02584 [Salpingoeca rosetta]EGD81899.1 hypothetical protein PTSG_02584 [Salpingoeca rosetta]|eukprot:XP_004996082.1 hypothetical protein PTSG_02584 [Salpingoeca rosetta]